MLKKISSILGVMCLAVVLLTACSGKPSEKKSDTEEKEASLQVVSTIFAPYDFAKNVAGSYGDVKMMLPPASESHSYEPTPQDIIAIQQCDVFIYVGGESETWVEEILADIDTEKVQVIKCIDLVDPLEEEIVEGMEAEEEEESEEEVEYDEHVWTTPKNAILLVNKMIEEFGKADAAHKDAYESQGQAYIQQLEELDQEFQDIVSKAKYHTLIVGDRFPLRYFTEEYGLEYYAAFPGCSEETETSAATITFLVDKVKEEKIPVVLYMELSNGQIADTICESTGAEEMMYYPCHNITKDDFQNGVGYVDLMKKNVKTLRKALGAE